MKKDDVQGMLWERGTRYGNVDHQAQMFDELMKLIGDSPNFTSRMSARQRQSLTVIALKISRICHGDPNYPDSWKDIEGYARLAVDGPHGGADSDGGEPD